MSANEVRTNIVINEDLMRDAMKLAGCRTKREMVEEALKTVIRLKRQREVLKLRGKVRWAGNLDEMRQSRFPDWIEAGKRVAAGALGRPGRSRKRASR